MTSRKRSKTISSRYISNEERGNNEIVDNPRIRKTRQNSNEVAINNHVIYSASNTYSLFNSISAAEIEDNSDDDSETGDLEVETQEVRRQSKIYFIGFHY